MYQLRELTKEDMRIVNQWRNDPELIACLGAPFRFINQDVDDAWFQSYMQSRGKAVRCAVVEEANPETILGMVSLVDINNINRSAQLHIMIGDLAVRGRGLGTYAVKAIIQHAFLNLNLRRIELDVLETNQAAIHLYEKCGFVREGMKRQSNYKNGKYINMIIMSVLKQDCQELLEHTL